MPFLGITLDTVKLEARLPLDKVEKCRQGIEVFISREKVSLKELQSTLGLLSWACAVILPGRAFLRRLFDLTMRAKKPFHRIRLTRETKKDLQLWLSFLNQYNGRSFFHSDRFLSSQVLRLYTDASQTWGYGAILDKSWFHGQWPLTWCHLNITVLELFPIVAAICTWGSALQSKNILFFTDNMALVSIINGQTSKHKQVMFLVRLLVSHCLKFDICFQAQHISGKRNLVADRLSRGRMAEFRTLAPLPNLTPAKVPQDILPGNLRDMLAT